MYDGGICSSGIDCAKNCAYDGIPLKDYQDDYGVHTNGTNLTL